MFVGWQLNISETLRLHQLLSCPSKCVNHLVSGASDAASWSTELKRRVQHYGWRYDYRARNVTPEDYLGPLPDWLSAIAEQLVVDGHFDRAPDQVIINEYLPGQGIAPHVDCLPCFGDTIASLSLLSATTMVFDHPHTNERRELRLEPGDLLVMKGEWRTKWRHSIPARKSDMVNGARVPRSRRVSLTFRNVII